MEPSSNLLDKKELKWVFYNVESQQLIMFLRILQVTYNIFCIQPQLLIIVRRDSLVWLFVWTFFLQGDNALSTHHA